MSIETKIDNSLQIQAILAYNKAHHQPTWCVHTQPGKKMGTSAKLIGLHSSGRYALTQLANGDLETVPTVEIHLRGLI